MSVSSVVLSDADWRAQTKAVGSTLGSSAAAVAMGVGYKSRFAFWAEATGKVPAETTIPADRRRRLLVGTALEPLILDELRVVKPDLQVELPPPGQHLVLRNSEFPHLHDTPDGLIVAPFRGPIEAKSVDERDTDWGVEASLYSLVQTHHHFLVGGTTEGLIAAWVGLHGKEFLTYEVTANREFLEKLQQALAELWACIQNDTPPAVDGDESTLAALKAMYPKDDGTEAVLDEPVWRDCVEAWRDAKDRIKSANEEAETIENMLRSAIGTASYGVIPGFARVSNKTIGNKGRNCKGCGDVIQKPYTYRSLREVKL